MKRKTRIMGLILALLMLTGLTAGCGSTQQEPPASDEPVVLTVAGAWEDCRAIETVGRAFTEEYPNCTIQYEYLQDYSDSLLKRMSGENTVDLFFTNSIQADSEFYPYAQELLSCEELDLSDTFEGLIDNFMFFGEDESAQEKLFAIPLGAEIRGIYVNKTLLDSLNIEIPSNQAELLAACKTLKENGYIPFHGNPGNFAQRLLYPWICNLIANADDPVAAYDKINSRSEGLGEMFKEPFEFLYSLIENGYYDYKTAQDKLNLFADASDESSARNFLNICQNGEEWEKVDDVGQVAFFASAMSLQGTIEKVKDDYHSAIEYVFMPAPVGEDGGYAYMSPAHGIAANKGSEDLDWSIRFLNYLFAPENNKLFAQEFNIVPNTKEAFSYISTLFDVPDNHISQLGQVTFDYGFYSIITETLVNISKGNNPKYMQENGDGSLSLYPLEYYIDAFEEGIRGDAQ